MDVEASGFGAGSYPIEVGFVLPDGSAYCTLISPEDDWRHWDSGAEKIHGIARSLLFSHGRSARQVAMDLNGRLAGSSVYTDSWYHDFNWMHRLFDAAEQVPRFALKDLLSLLDDSQAARWDTLKAQVLAELQLERHRASHDARILQVTYQRLMEP